MGNTNVAKAEQLGMPAGTAANRLRKQLLFKYVRMVGDDICFVCKDRIEDIAEFTIEHIKPWFNRDPELFWDLDNIAFSHASCNRPHNVYNGRKKAPEGKKWCPGCEDSIPVSEFHKDAQKWDGLHSRCKKHRQR